MQVKVGESYWYNIGIVGRNDKRIKLAKDEICWQLPVVYCKYVSISA